MGYAGPNRRKHTRIDRRFMARFRVRGDAPWQIVILKNLSASGALFYCDRRLDVGTIVELRINFPLYQKSVIATVARTVRVESPVETSVYRIAVTFTEIGRDEQDSIDRAANDLYSDDIGT